MNSSLCLIFVCVAGAVVSLAAQAAAGECTGAAPASLTNCEVTRAGDDGQSCQFTNPKTVCLKAGEYMTIEESVTGLTSFKFRSIGCQAGGIGKVTGAADQTSFKSNLVFNSLKAENKTPDKSCAAPWKYASIADAVAALIKEVKATCKNPQDKVGASTTCKDIQDASIGLAKQLQ